MPSSIRPAFAALWALDLAFADVVSTTSDPRLGAIRLAWWRERLEAIGEGAVPDEPRLQAVATALVPRGVTGARLSMLEDCWLPVLEPFPWGPAQARGFAARGGLLFAIGAALLGGDKADVQAAGELWSLHDGAVHCSDLRSRAMLGEAARLALESLPSRVPRSLRPLTMLAALAACDLAAEGRLKRGGAALRHQLTGRFPR